VRAELIDRAKDEKEFPGRLHTAKYPWDQWFDGRIWRLVKGEDFDVSEVNMRSSIYVAAKRLGKSATVSVQPDALYIQALSVNGKADGK